MSNSKTNKPSEKKPKSGETTFFAKVGAWFKNLWEKIKHFFTDDPLHGKTKDGKPRTKMQSVLAHFTPKRLIVYAAVLVLAVGVPVTVALAGGGYAGRSINALDTARKVTYLSDYEKDIILELNKLRSNPVKWCKEVNLTMLDGLTPEQEFIQDKYNRGYTKKYPLPLIYPSKGLWLAAFDNNNNCQVKGGLAHSEWTGRVDGRYGSAKGGVGENNGPADIINQASGGKNDAAKLVNEMVRDRGVADKGHRKNCMEAKWNVVGVSVSCGYVTFDFAGGFTDFPYAMFPGADTVNLTEISNPFAAYNQLNDNADGESVIKLTFDKPVSLNLNEIRISADDTTATFSIPTKLSNGSGDNTPQRDWYLFLPVHYSGNVGIIVTKSGVMPWRRIVGVSKKSDFKNLTDFKAFLESPTGHGGSADDPISVSLASDTTLTGTGEVAKVTEILKAVKDAGKYVYLSVGVANLLNWPAVTDPDAIAGAKFVVGLNLPMNFTGNTPIDVTIDANAFTAYTNLQTVYCFNVTSIGAGAFNGLVNLQTASFPRLTSIGAGAYTGCTALNAVGASIVVGDKLDLTGSGLPQGMIDKYNAENKAGGYNSSGDVTYYLELKDGTLTWSKRN